MKKIIIVLFAITLNLILLFVVGTKDTHALRLENEEYTMLPFTSNPYLFYDATYSYTVPSTGSIDDKWLMPYLRFSINNDNYTLMTNLDNLNYFQEMIDLNEVVFAETSGINSGGLAEGVGLSRKNVYFVQLEVFVYSYDYSYTPLLQNVSLYYSKYYQTPLFGAWGNGSNVNYPNVYYQPYNTVFDSSYSNLFKTNYEFSPTNKPLNFTFNLTLFFGNGQGVGTDVPSYNGPETPEYYNQRILDRITNKLNIVYKNDDINSLITYRDFKNFLDTNTLSGSYQNGYRVGVENGKTQGYQNGYEIGRADGYTKGYEDAVGSTPINTNYGLLFIQWFFTFITYLGNFEILPGLTIALVAGLPIIVGLIKWLFLQMPSDNQKSKGKSSKKGGKK